MSALHERAYGILIQCVPLARVAIRSDLRMTFKVVGGAARERDRFDDGGKL